MSDKKEKKEKSEKVEKKSVQLEPQVEKMAEEYVTIVSQIRGLRKEKEAKIGEIVSEMKTKGVTSARIGRHSITYKEKDGKTLLSVSKGRKVTAE